MVEPASTASVTAIQGVEPPVDYCPGCDSESKFIAAANRNRSRCPVCGLDHQTRVQVLKVRARRGELKRSAKHYKLEREVEQLRRINREQAEVIRGIGEVLRAWQDNRS